MSPARSRRRDGPGDLVGGLAGQVLGDLADQLFLQHPVPVLAQLAERLGRGDDQKLVELAFQRLPVQQRRDPAGEGVLGLGVVVGVGAAGVMPARGVPGSTSGASMAFSSTSVAWPVLWNITSFSPSTTATTAPWGSIIAHILGFQ